jgi:hypothetical protein
VRPSERYRVLTSDEDLDASTTNVRAPTFHSPFETELDRFGQIPEAARKPLSADRRAGNEDVSIGNAAGNVVDVDELLGNSGMIVVVAQRVGLG